jgi:hypothetical protein
VRAFLLRLHQPAALGNTSGKDRRQTPLDPFRHLSASVRKRLPRIQA